MDSDFDESKISGTETNDLLVDSSVRHNCKNSDQYDPDEVNK